MPLDFFHWIHRTARLQGRPRVFVQVVSLRQVITLPSHDRSRGFIQDVNLALAVPILPRPNHGRGHRALLTSQDVDEHGVVPKFHTEASDIW